MKPVLFRYGFFLLLGTLFFLTACGPREISEKKMKAIIHDVFLVNAYYSQFGAGKINPDSVDFYTPILEKYGYDIEDFRYTLDRWALKKSSRLSALVDDATAEIQRENQYYLARERDRNRVDSMIRERYTDTLLYRPDSIWVRRLKEKESLIMRMAVPEGAYQLSYRYLIDTKERNTSLVMRYNLRNSKGMAVESNSKPLLRNGKTNYINAAFTVGEKADSLELLLADYTAKAKDSVAFRVDSLLITYTRPIEELRERFLKDMIRFELGIEFPYELNYPPKDSSTLHLVPPLRPDTAGRSEL